MNKFTNQALIILLLQLLMLSLEAMGNTKSKYNLSGSSEYLATPKEEYPNSLPKNSPRISTIKTPFIISNQQDLIELHDYLMKHKEQNNIKIGIKPYKEIKPHYKPFYKGEITVSKESNDCIIPYNFFNSLEHILELDLSLNPRQIDDLSFLAPLQYLKKLNLSSNAIKSIETLPHLPQLETIILDNNQIRDIDILIMFPKLRQIRIKGNPIEYWPEELILKELIEDIKISWKQ